MTDSRHTEPVAANALARNVQTRAPNHVWVSDSTYLPTREGWLYRAVVRDLYARRVGGWSTAATLERPLVLRAIEGVRNHRQGGVGLLHHADRGNQYARSEYQALLAKAAITPREPEGQLLG